MILVIHTIQREGIELAVLTSSGQILGLSHTPVKGRQTELVTPAIDHLLKRLRLKLSHLSGIVVATGPGGFTAVRSGVVVANALGLALQIPVKGIEGEFASVVDMLRENRFARLLSTLKRNRKPSFARPSYGAEPHITQSKQRKVQQHRLKLNSIRDFPLEDKK